jgi:hypothetical protein
MAMQISEKHRKEIEKIIADLKCPVDVACYKSGFENVCNASIVGDGTVTECSQENHSYCGFRFSFGYSYFCKCPLRVYAAKNLKI